MLHKGLSIYKQDQCYNKSVWGLENRKRMSIRRSNNGQTNNNINRGFAVTQTGAIGFSEDVETERFCSALKNNQSMQTQQQMISDLVGLRY
jgi:hypothetical protein